MRFFRLQKLALALSLLAVVGFVVSTTAPVAHAQSNISGDIVGTVSDATGAFLPGAQVTVTNNANGQVKVVTTDKLGYYRVPLLEPGRYKVSITSTGFETTTQEITVSAGVVTQLSVKLTVGKASTTVEVSSGAIQVLHVEDAQLSTSFDLQQLQDLPNPGGDLTFVAQTTPGAVMNTQGGYGNFSTNGLPATSNTFTMNGGYEGDPYLNVNNSGATNLLLGSNDVETVTVTTNSYDAAFGGLGGAQVNEISRSGGSKYHGNLVYLWNGRAMNANSFFNKQGGAPRNFDNANQWAAAIGGPLKKDKIFGFIDTEGIRVIIPNIGTVAAPSAGYQAAILAPAGSTADSVNYAPYGNLADNGLSAEAPLYQAIFSYYNNARNYSLGKMDVYGDPDVWTFPGQSTNFASEWLVNDRLDVNLSAADHMYIHSKVDHGIQPTATSFLNPIFNAQSPQPSYEGQLNETHTFSPQLTNQFLFAASYYRAIFTNTNATKLASTIPFVLIPEGYASGGSWDVYGGQPNWIGNVDYAFPQGRNVTGYQFNDDLSWTKGKHNLKVGYTFRRDDITDYTDSEHNINYAGGESIIYDQGDFAAGYSDAWVERFPRRLTEPVALYVEGFYVQDQWKPIPSFTVTAGLRMEHNSNPLCRTNCVANFSQDFSSLPTSRATPYNSLIASGRSQAFFQQQNLAWEPRLGFSYLPSGPGSKTTIRGGFGMFADYFPAQIMGDLVGNVPNEDRFTVLGAAYGNMTTLDSTRSDSGHAQAVTSNNALQSLFSQGGYYRNAAGTCPDSLSIYCATGGVFTRPAFISVAHKISLPTYEEWSLAIEHQVAKNTAIAVTYVGNRSYHQPVSRLPQAYDTHTDPTTLGSNASLPTSRPNAALGTVTEFYSGSSSNFNGLQATATSRLGWLTMQFNYVYGHALDTSSNGGFDAFGVNGGSQINPYNLAQNYGNADYDTRHYISANYSIRIPHFAGPRVLVDNWEFAGTIFHNSGYPFSVTDNTGSSGPTYAAVPLARQIDNNFNHHCGGKSHTLGANGTAAPTPCDFASHFTFSTDYGQQRRNQQYGPNYTDFDMDLSKAFTLPRWEAAKLKVAVQFFNTFNHPNFQIPDFDVNDATVGVITSAASTPTSVLGAFLGGDASPRLIQLKATFVF
ncbi:MAG TPA: carboxypeptidase regulatory-like domain-containing protein [Terracidiphilus sp.]|nr:carboxypeptidase regulatory-like domain-containing protein [Terracidiphilus sp.]